MRLYCSWPVGYSNQTCMPTFKHKRQLCPCHRPPHWDKEGSTTEAVALISVAAVADVIMTPMDVAKQRMQLGYHHQNSVLDAVRALSAVGRAPLSSPTAHAGCEPTRVTAVMSTSTSSLRNKFDEKLIGIGIQQVRACSGALAAAATAPLDAIKTRMQTQHISTSCGVRHPQAGAWQGGCGRRFLVGRLTDAHLRMRTLSPRIALY